jgi:hypothetical protein
MRTAVVHRNRSFFVQENCLRTGFLLKHSDNTNVPSCVVWCCCLVTSTIAVILLWTARIGLVTGSSAQWSK